MPKGLLESAGYLTLNWIAVFHSEGKKASYEAAQHPLYSHDLVKSALLWSLQAESKENCK